MSPISRTVGADCAQRWEQRALRARELAEEHAANQAALEFYEQVLRFQSDVACAAKVGVTADLPLREQIDADFLSSKMPALLALITKVGPGILRTEAGRLHNEGPSRWKHVIQASLDSGDSGLSETEQFFGRACLQPVAELLQMQLPQAADYGGNGCPACGGLPQMAVLRPEGEGSSRWLLCSFCLCEWLFRRICCSWCGELEKAKLPRYSAEQCNYVYVEACDTCKRYLKAIDMSIDGLAVPLVDEAALAVLDVWTESRGYEKIVQNLIGF